MPDLRTRLYRAQRLIARYRRPLAATLAAAAALTLVHVLAPPPPTTTGVVVAGHDLIGGSTITAGDVRVVRVTSAAVPSTALLSLGSAVGRIVAGPVATGELITSTRLVGPGLAAGFGPGRVSAPVRLADAEAVALLRVGDQVDVYAATDRGDEALAVVRRASVVAIPMADPTGSTNEGALVVLAVSPAEAGRLTQAAGRSPLMVTMQ